MREKDIESYELREESENLRDRVELLETIVKQVNVDEFETYLNKYN